MHRPAVLAAWLFAAGLAGAAADDAMPPRLAPLRAYAVEGNFESDDGPPPARDLSGIACAPASDRTAERVCLVVNDSDRFAQLAIIREGGLIVGPTVGLIAHEPSAATVGSEPKELACSGGEGGFKDLDGEAVAYAPPFFYVIGSHGCSRRNRFHPSRFILARLRIGERGRVVDEAGREPSSSAEALRFVETTYRLADVLRLTEPAATYFGRDLGPNGVNVEGLAIVDGILYAGLRAPSLDGTAYIVSTDVDALFSPQTPPPPPSAGVIPVALGTDTGIRDLAPLGDGRLLVLAGPAQDQAEVPFALYAIEPRPGGRVTRLATLDDVGPNCTPGARAGAGKPEAILPLGTDEDRLRVLVLFDGLPNGSPCEYSVSMR